MYTQALSYVAVFVIGAVFATVTTLGAWTGPTQTAPNGNVSAPVNVGSTDQVKNAGLGVNSLAVFGNSILSGTTNYLNFGTVSGTTGYGIRNNNGTIEFKNNGGSWAAFGSGALGGSGTANYLSKFTGAATLATSTVYDDGNYVGIGDSTPAQKLDVNGNLRIGTRTLYLGDAQTLVGDNASALYWDSNSTSTTQLIMRDANDVNYGRIYGAGAGTQFGLLDGDAQWSYLALKDDYTQFRVNNVGIMTLNDTGDVGIGTMTVPAVTLALGDTDTGFDWVSDGNFALYTNNTERMRFNSSGSVGIGTTTPSQMLSVGGTIYSGSGGFRFPDGTVQTSAAVTSSISGTRAQVFTSSGTFTVPAGVTAVKVTVIGGGAGVSGSTGGGAGGAAVKWFTNLTPGTNISAVVGSGGASNAAGGNSSFNGVVANGGGTSGGLSVGGSASGGDFNITGGTGSSQTSGSGFNQITTPISGRTYALFGASYGQGGPSGSSNNGPFTLGINGGGDQYGGSNGVVLVEW